MRLISALLLILTLKQYYTYRNHSLSADDASDIVVTWSTRDLTNSSVVEYGIGGLSAKSSGSASLFVDGGHERRSQYIHRVTLSNLLPEETYRMYD